MDANHQGDELRQCAHGRLRVSAWMLPSTRCGDPSGEIITPTPPAACARCRALGRRALRRVRALHASVPVPDRRRAQLPPSRQRRERRSARECRAVPGSRSSPRCSPSAAMVRRDDVPGPSRKLHVFTIESPPPLRAICSTVRGFAAVGVVPHPWSRPSGRPELMQRNEHAPLFAQDVCTSSHKRAALCIRVGKSSPGRKTYPGAQEGRFPDNPDQDRLPL